VRPWFKERVLQDPALAKRVADAAASDASTNVRVAAVTLLGALDVPFARAALAARLVGPARDREMPVRAAAAEALSGQDSPEVRAALVAALLDEAVEVRRAAVGALQRIAGTTNGYVAEDPPEKRGAALRSWQEWAKAR
jgi:HEAT repeat protein